MTNEDIAAMHLYDNYPEWCDGPLDIQTLANLLDEAEARGAAAERALATPLLTDAHKELTQLVQDIGGCEHDVGVCCCGLVRLVSDIDAYLGERHEAETLRRL